MRKNNKLIIFLIIIGISIGMSLFIANNDFFFTKNLSSGNSEKATLRTSSNSLGIEVCTADEKQFYLVMCEDGNGNVITAWVDFRKNYQIDIYAQKIDSSGNVKWLKNGIKIFNDNVSHIVGPKICDDSAGGAIISWLQELDDDFIMKAQRIDADGNLLWGNNGVIIANTTWAISWMLYSELCSDEAGGAFMMWLDEGINIRKVDPNGNLLWSYNGLAEGFRPKICSDGVEGVIITWDDWDRGDEEENGDVYAQRFDAYGNYLWGENGTVICNADLDQGSPEICSDGVGGAIITWYDERPGGYVQRVDSDGNCLWGNNGTKICGESYSISDIKSDGENGMILLYVQYVSLEEKIYYYGQKLDSNGNEVWGENGTKITEYDYNLDSIHEMQICSDGEGGALFAWILRKGWSSIPHLYNNSDIYAQKINVNGQAIWKENGLPVCVPASDYRSIDSGFQICNDGAGGAIIGFEFVRSRWNNTLRHIVPYLWDIHAQRISSSGDIQWNVEPDWIFFAIIGVIIGGLATASVITVVLIRRRK